MGHQVIRGRHTANQRLPQAADVEAAPVLKQHQREAVARENYSSRHSLGGRPRPALPLPPPPSRAATALTCPLRATY